MVTRPTDAPDNNLSSHNGHARGRDLKVVILAEGFQSAARILRNVRRAIRPDGRLVLIDVVLRSGNEPDPGRGLDMHMLVTQEGRERTAAEIGALLEEASLAVTRVIPTVSMTSIVESRPG